MPRYINADKFIEGMKLAANDDRNKLGMIRVSDAYRMFAEALESFTEEFETVFLTLDEAKEMIQKLEQEET